MRTIIFTIQGEQPLPSTMLAGQAGEHLDTRLSFSLPDEWRGMDEYYLHFFTETGRCYKTRLLHEPVQFPCPSTADGRQPGAASGRAEGKGNPSHLHSKASGRRMPGHPLRGDRNRRSFRGVGQGVLKHRCKTGIGSDWPLNKRTLSAYDRRASCAYKRETTGYGFSIWLRPNSHMSGGKSSCMFHISISIGSTGNDFPGAALSIT